MLLELFINFESLITANKIAYKYIFAKFLRYIDITTKKLSISFVYLYIDFFQYIIRFILRI